MYSVEEIEGGLLIVDSESHWRAYIDKKYLEALREYFEGTHVRRNIR